MKKKWLINLLMLTCVVGISLFLHFKPQATDVEEGVYEMSSLKMAGFDAVKVEFPTAAPVTFSKVDGLWRITAPYQARADQRSVQQIMSIIAARTRTKLPASDLSKYGLDKPSMRLKLTTAGAEHVFSFGTHNPVTEEQYIGYNGSAYLLPVSYAEAAATPPVEMIEKHPLSVAERQNIVGFDLSRLEQFEAIGLNVDVDAGQWKTNVKAAKPTQNEMNEWLEFFWVQAQAKSVELYQPDRNKTFPSFTIKLKNGKKVVLEKMQESPEYLLARPDEGIIYHFANDVGFSMVNPPLNIE